MSNAIDLTRIVKCLNSAERGYTKLHSLLIDDAIRAAECRISCTMRPRLDAEAIANWSVFQAIEQLRKRKSRVSLGDLRRLLRRIIRTSTCDEVRKATAKMRDIRIESSIEEGSIGITPRVGPLDRIIHRQFRVEVVQQILQEPDEVSRMICILGIMCDEFVAAMIQDAIAPYFDAPVMFNGTLCEQVPCIRSIQSIIAKAKIRLRTELSGEWSELFGRSRD